MSGLLYATFMGGNQAAEHVDGGTSRFSPEGYVYQSVCAGCGGYSDFPTTAGVYSTTNTSSNCTNALFKIQFTESIVKADFSYPDNLCAPASITFDNASSGAQTYTWYVVGLDTFITTSTASVIFDFEVAGVYEVVLIGSTTKNCFVKPIDTISQFITVVEPYLEVGADFSFVAPSCPGDTVSFFNETTQNAQFSWQFADRDGWLNTQDSIVDHIFYQSGTYSVTLAAKNDSDCFVNPFDTVMFEYTVLSVPTVNAGEDTTIYEGCPASLEACCGVSYYWFPDYEMSNRFIANPVVTPPRSMQYYVQLTDEFGCTNVDSVFIKVVDDEMMIPNVITPNGDEINDYFDLGLLKQTTELYVYNRWGKLLFHDEDYANDFNGDELSDGVYFYEILQEDVHYKGWVHILR